MEYYCLKHKDQIEKHAYFISRNNGEEHLIEDLEQEGYLLICEEYNKGMIHNYNSKQVGTALVRTMMKYVRAWQGQTEYTSVPVEQLPA